MLDKIRVGINKAYQEICDRDNYVTAEKVRNAFLGIGIKAALMNFLNSLICIVEQGISNKSKMQNKGMKI